MEVISTFCQNMNEAIRLKKATVPQLQSCNMIWFYNPISGEAKISIDELDGSKYSYKLAFSKHDFLRGAKRRSKSHARTKQFTGTLFDRATDSPA